MENKDLEHKISLWEQHGTTVFNAISVALLLWVGSSVVNLEQAVAVIQTKVNDNHTLVSVVTEMQQDIVKIKLHVQVLDSKIQYLETEQRKR